MDFVGLFHEKWKKEFFANKEGKSLDNLPPVMSCLKGSYFDCNKDQMKALKDAQEQSNVLIKKLYTEIHQQEFINKFLGECCTILGSTLAMTCPIYEGFSDFYSSDKNTSQTEVETDKVS